MNKWAIWIIGTFLLGYAYAAPRNPFPKSPDEIWRNDQDLRDDIKFSKGSLDSKTVAQFKATTPLKKGLMYFCSDCTNALVCVSTGTTIYGFANMQAANRTTTCN